ncbi:hypothetical protein G7Y79_00041g077380 [Physcia stellaris]|nr:hypothetical protein G7Y79_00041g077380 [Physcia stellaris]
MFMIYKSVYVLQGIGSTLPAVLPSTSYRLPELVASDREADHAITSVLTSREFVQKYQQEIRQVISDASALAAPTPEVVKQKPKRAPTRRSSNPGSQDQQVKQTPHAELLGSQSPSRSDGNSRAQLTNISKPSIDLAIPSLKRKLSGLESSENQGVFRSSSDYGEVVSGRPSPDLMRHYQSTSSPRVPFWRRPHDEADPAQETLELSNVMRESRVADSKSPVSFGAEPFSAGMHDDVTPAQQPLEKPSNLPRDRIAYYTSRLAEAAPSSVAKNNALRDNEAMRKQLADVASFCGMMAAYLDTYRHELQARFSEMAKEADAGAECSEESHVLKCMLKDLADFSRQSSVEVKLPSVSSDSFVAGDARDAFSAAYNSNYRGRAKEFYDSLTIHDDWQKKLEEYDAANG